MRDEREYRRELRSYVFGLASASLLTVFSFVVVAAHLFPVVTTLWCLAAFAIVQVVCHFRFFLHIDLSKSKRDDLQLILFSTLIVILMVGGTIWILSNQKMRMM